VVYPKGLDKQWNDGRSLQRNKSDDLAFVDALLKDLQSRLKIDKKRIFATGISNGGFMSFLLACERADVFAAVAPVAANLSIGRLDQCKPSQPISLLNIVGTDDTTVPFKGGRVKVFLGIKDRGRVLSSDETLQKWLKIDGCSDKAQLSTIDKVSTDKTSIEDSRYVENCKNNTEVRRIVVVGGGHAWPGHKPNHRLFAGAMLTSEEIDATEVIWKFFSEHARK
jgi:polyhydroxybutyrate depolymerase